jgi:ABC-2 type transport system permease protein
MKIIFKIAKTELKNLFYSPIAWFLIIAFMVTCAIVYMGMVDSNAQGQEMGGYALEYMRDLTSRIFTGPGGLFATVMKNLYLFMPLLTMGLISREINGGTIKLLYSSPVTIRDIVFGKYLAMMIYSLILTAVVVIFMIAGFFHVVALDSGMLLSSVLGLYLLLCAYAAIGLFMSSLTTYQVVAAISTFLMIGILSYIGEMWQGIDFIRDLAYFLSLSGRTGHMLNGLLTTKDVIYFVVIVYIFLGLTIFKMKAGRESKPFAVKAGRYAFIIVSALAVGYITSRPSMTGYIDTTRNQKMTLTKNAQAIVKQLGSDELEVTMYNNLLDNHNWQGFPEQRNRYLAVWEPYTRFKPDISFKYVSYYDSVYNNGANSGLMMQYPGKNLKQMAELQAKNFRVDLDLFLSPAQIHKLVDLAPEQNRFVMQLKYKGKTTFLRVFDDQEMWPGETEVSAAFKRLMSARLPKIAFLKGNLERDINKDSERDYKVLTNMSTFRYSLINQGFDTDTLSLETQDIPANVSAIVIADPKTALSGITLSKIEQYIAKGGNLLIAGEPGKEGILNPLLSKLGVQLMSGSIVQPEKELPQNLVQNNITAFAAGFTKNLGKSREDSTVLTMPGATGIVYDANGPFKVRALAESNEKKSWLKKSRYVLDSVMLTFSGAEGDIRQSFATAVALTRNINGREQRIVVAGDADFMSTGELKRYGVKNCNFIFNTALYSWLSYGEFPIDTSRPESKDKRMKVSTDQLKIQKIIFIWILPSLIAAFAAILLIRRKRK